jgi:hypothetical protein
MGDDTTRDAGRARQLMRKSLARLLAGERDNRKAAL